jgi:hypothetical protein
MKLNKFERKEGTVRLQTNDVRASQNLAKEIVNDPKTVYCKFNINKKAKYASIIVDEPTFDRIVEKVEICLHKNNREPRLLQCTKCEVFKPKENFYKNKNSKSGYHSWCKDCVKKSYHERRRRRMNE